MGATNKIDSIKMSSIKMSKRPGRRKVEDDFVEDDSGDHTSDQEVDTDEDSAGSLVDFVVDDDAPIASAAAYDSEEEVKQVEIIETATYENGVRRSTRNRKPVERYVDSDYEELMCADADPDAALESEEHEEEEETDTEMASDSDEEESS